MEKVKFTYNEQEIELTIGEFISLIKILKNRNSRLYNRFLLFYDNITSDDDELKKFLKRLFK